MNGSIRVAGSQAPILRAPYAAPHNTLQSQTPSTAFTPAGSAAGGAFGDLASGTLPYATGAGAELASGSLRVALEPYVPREFRAVADTERGRAVIQERGSEPAPAALFTEVDLSEPAADDAYSVVDDAGEESAAKPSVEEPAGTDDALTVQHSFGALAEPEPTVELPWIDAFADDAATADESWPLDDAGRRLDELAQSLGSLDASRERDQGDSDAAGRADRGQDKVQERATVSMWTEDEWIDIMPLPVQDESRDDAVARIAAMNAELASARVEAAALALEELAMRVRDGHVTVPAFPSDIAQEAMLAGLLASMLGWRQ